MNNATPIPAHFASPLMEHPFFMGHLHGSQEQDSHLQLGLVQVIYTNKI
jgi:hypothetical protein